VNPDELAELEEQRRFLLRSLDDLDRELAAGDIDALDATTLRDDYTHRLAEVQRAIEGGRALVAEQVPPRRFGRRVVAVVVVAALAGGAGLVVANAAGSRKPGDTVTGNITERNFDGLLTQAARDAQDGKFADALENYDTVLDQDPDNVEALSEKGLLLASLAVPTQRPTLLEEGEKLVRQAIAAEPDLARPRFYLGLVLQLRDDTDGALAAFDEALARDPSDALEADIQQYRDALLNPTTTTTTAG
jgi:tetratricopeptide (TPR) repeat protein